MKASWQRDGDVLKQDDGLLPKVDERRSKRSHGAHVLALSRVTLRRC